MRAPRDPPRDGEPATLPTAPAAVTAPTAPAAITAPTRDEGSAGGAAHAIQVGDVVGRHQLIARLGQGGMGQVFAAHDAGLDRTVAIKFVSVVNAAMVERFLAEARVTARCTHPNIVGVHEIGRHGDAPYLVLEYLAGPSLAKLVRGGERLPVARVIAIMTAVARALACAHSHGIVHRDLTPSNVVVLPDGTVKVLDFGIAAYASARAGAEDETAARPGEVAGTLRYMAPEQVAGHDVDGRADLWAFGVVLYELLAGVRPYDHLDEAALRAELLDPARPTPSITTHRADLPPALVQVVARCLEKTRARRVGSADELVAALQALAGDDAPARAPRRSRPTAALAAGVAVISLVAGVAWWRGRAAAPRSTAAPPAEVATRLERLERAEERLRTAGDTAAADALFAQFVAQPENAALVAEAWLRRSDRETARRALEPALASAAAGYLAARDAATVARALTAVVAIQLARRRWDDVERALALRGRTDDPAIARAAEALAVATRRASSRGAAVAPAQAAARALATGRLEPGEPRAAAAVDLDGDGRDEVVALDGAALRAWRPGDGPWWQAPGPAGGVALCAGRDGGGAWLAAPDREVTPLYRVDGRGATRVFTAGRGATCAIGDLDGDGAAELYVGDWRDLVRYRAEPDGTWRATRLSIGSVVNALVAADLDGDGRTELAVAAGEWQAYDVRVLGGAAMALVDRIRLGRVAALAALARGPGQPRILLARKDRNWPSVLFLPPDRPAGVPDGYYALRLAAGRLRVTGHLADELSAMNATLHAADLDGDGRDEGVATEVEGHVRVVHVDDAGGLDGATVEGLAILAAGRFDDAPGATAVARVADGPRTSTWWLGGGPTPLPPVAAAPHPPAAAVPAGLDASLAITWRRATDLVAVGATASALAAFEQLAAVAPPDQQAPALAEVLALRQRRGDPLGAIHEALAARAAPRSRAQLAALSAAAAAATDDGELAAAVRVIDAALASPALGAAERASLLATRAQVEPFEVTLFDGGPLDDAWQILDPIGVRRDPVRRALVLDAFGAQPLAALELTRTRGPVELIVEGTITRAEWAAGLGFALRPLADGAPPVAFTLRNMGGGGIYHLATERIGLEVAEDELELHPDITAPVALRARITWFPERGRVIWDLTVGERRLRRTAHHPPVTAARWRVELTSHNRGLDDAPTRAVLGLARLAVAGLARGPVAPPSPLADARRALADGALDRVPALLARAAGPDAALIEAVRALRAGESQAALAALGRLRGRGPASEEVQAQLAHLARAEDGAHADAVRAAAGADRIAVIARAWAIVAWQHPEAELVQRELTQNLRELELRGPAPAAAALLFLRARARAAIGEPAAAEADLDALLAPSRAGPIPDDVHARAHVERARLAARRGATDLARRAVLAALDASKWPEAVADTVLLDPALAALAAGPGLERVRALGRPLATP